MKKIVLFALALCMGLGLTACGPKTPLETPPATETVTADDRSALLLGSWENRGQYEENKDFVETLTLSPDGEVQVHLDYQGVDYATLTGTYTAENGILTVTLRQGADGNPYVRTYAYQVDEASLRLQNEEKDVLYQRVE